jgi:hypothetical protein
MPFTIALDYDGTCFYGGISGLGPPNKEVLDKAIEFRKEGAQIALWTCREGKYLAEAIARCKEHGLEFDSINENTPSGREFVQEQIKEGNPLALRKILCDIYVDDKAHGSIDHFLNINVSETCKRYANR